MKHCVYKCFDEHDVLLYVGMTSYFHKRMGRHSYNSDWYDRVSKIEVKLFKTRGIALAEETKAIEQQNPLFNKIHIIDEFKIRKYYEKRGRKAMTEEALQQSKQLYRDLLVHFDCSPIKIATAFEFIHDDSDTAERRKACARVGMWAHMGVPKKYASKAAELIDA